MVFSGESRWRKVALYAGLGLLILALLGALQAFNTSNISFLNPDTSGATLLFTGLNALAATEHPLFSAAVSFLIFGAMASVTLLAMAWALFLRRKHHHRHRHHHHGHHDSSELAETSLAPNEADATAGPEKRRRRRRRSGRHHRPRNPTLAETGGLPPIRPPGPSAPQP